MGYYNSFKSVDLELDKKVFTILKNKVNLPGFRPGKVPTEILLKKIWTKRCIRVLDKLINESLTKAVKERKLKPSVQPKVDIKKFEEGKDLEFNAIFQIMPEIPDFDLKKIIR